MSELSPLQRWTLASTAATAKYQDLSSELASLVKEHEQVEAFITGASLATDPLQLAAKQARLGVLDNAITSVTLRASDAKKAELQALQQVRMIQDQVTSAKYQLKALTDPTDLYTRQTTIEEIVATVERAHQALRHQGIAVEPFELRISVE